MTKQAILAIVADTHLSQLAWAKRPDLSGDAFFSFEQIISYCTTHDLDLLLLGDVFDKQRPDPMTIGFAATQLARMAAANRKVHYVQGQHEFDRTHPWLSAISEICHHSHKRSFSHKGLEIYGLDWTPGFDVKKELDAIPTTANIFAAHQVWRELMGNFKKYECSFTDVPHVQLILTGDYHRTVFLPFTNASGGDCLALSPGSTHMRSIDEPDLKSFFLLYDDLSLKYVHLETRRVLRMPIHEEAELDSVIDNINTNDGFFPDTSRLPSSIAKPILHVTFWKPVASAQDRLTAATNGRAHIFVSHAKQHKTEVEMLPNNETLDNTLEACLQELTDKDSELYTDVMGLLSSRDPNTQVEQLHDSFVRRSIGRILRATG